MAKEAVPPHAMPAEEMPFATAERRGRAIARKGDAIMEQSCSHCDNPDSSLLRVVLIGEIIRADEATLYTMAEIFQTLGLLELSPEDEIPEVKQVVQEKIQLRLVK